MQFCFDSSRQGHKQRCCRLSVTLYNTLKQAYEETSTDNKSVVGSHLNELPLI